MTREDAFLECLTSFEETRDATTTIAACGRAQDAGLAIAELAIVHGLAMRIWARQGDLEGARRELMHARQAVGTIIGLANGELEQFAQGRPTGGTLSKYRAILKQRLWYEENLAKTGLVLDLMALPAFHVFGDLNNQEARDRALTFLEGFPQTSLLYLLLGELWATHDMDRAIECFRMAESCDSSEAGLPPTASRLACLYKMGQLFRQIGDVVSAVRELQQVALASSHQGWDNQPDEERRLGEYWVARAREELAEIYTLVGEKTVGDLAGDHSPVGLVEAAKGNKPKNPLLAGILSFVGGGLGQLYVGQTLKGSVLTGLIEGIFMFLICGGYLLIANLLENTDMPWLGPVCGGALALSALALSAVSAIDAYMLAQRVNEGRVLGEWEWFASSAPKTETKAQ